MDAKKELVKKKYGCCLLTGLQQDITFHHLLKKSDGGIVSLENGAPLSDIAHRWLHNEIERNRIMTYKLINHCLRLLKIAFEQENWDLVIQWETEIMPLVWDSVLDYERERVK